MRPRLRLEDDVLHILAIGAHADDIELGCGGTILKLAAARPGLMVTWLVLTAAGDERRAAEATASAEAFLAGVARADVRLEAHPDRFLPYEPAGVKRTVAELAGELSGEAAPDLVLTHRREDRHQDHRFVAELTWQSFRTSTILEYEIPKWEGDLGQPNVYVHLDAAHVDGKVEALVRHFPSQHGKRWFDEEAFRALLRLRGIECNAPSGYAEAFTGTKLVIT